MGVDFDDKATQRGFDVALAAYEADCVKALDDFAADAVAVARALAPRETGELAASISEQGRGRDADGPYVDVGTTLDKGIYNEFGTDNMSPHPFMRPALAQAATRFGADG